MIMPRTTHRNAATVTHTDEYVLVDMGTPRPCLSNAAFGGGLVQARYIVNRTVPKGWSPTDPVQEMNAYLRDRGLDTSACVGLLTAVHVKSTVHHAEVRDGWSVEAFVTTGVRNAARAGGGTPIAHPVPGTINIILLVHGALPPAAMIDAVQVAVEAKCAALSDGDIRTARGEIATGTTTDTVTVACLGDEPTSLYAGTATSVGYAIGHVVHAAVTAGLGPARTRIETERNPG